MSDIPSSLDEIPVGPRTRDLTKEGKFGKLRAVKHLGRKYGRNVYWLCDCDCGGTSEVSGSQLTTGGTRSCGCEEGHWTHGRTGTPEWNSWYGLKARCNNPDDPAYGNYGGRGIRICDRWKSFELFLEDMGPRPKGFTLDRIDNNGNYEPGNCRWATRTTQNNNRRDNVLLKFNGETRTVAEWSKLTGIKSTTIHWRKNNGWNNEEILTREIQFRPNTENK